MIFNEKFRKFSNENFSDFEILAPHFGHEVGTFCNVSLRVFYEIPSDQKQMKIMIVYFQKSSGFPMLRSTQNDEKLNLLWWDP